MSTHRGGVRFRLAVVQVAILICVGVEYRVTRKGCWVLAVMYSIYSYGHR